MGLQTAKFLTGSLLSIAFAGLAVLPAAARPITGSDQLISQVPTSERTVSGTIVTVLRDAVTLRLPDGSTQVVNMPAGEVSRLNLQPGDRITASMNQNGVVQLTQTNTGSPQNPGNFSNPNLGNPAGVTTPGTTITPGNTIPSGNQGMQQPGMQQPGMQQPGMQQPGMQQPGMQQPGMQQPGMQQPGMQQPGMQQQPGIQQNSPTTGGQQPTGGEFDAQVDDGTGPVRALW